MAIVALGFLLFHVQLHGQWKQLPATGSPPERLPDRTTLAGQSGLGPLLTAKLIDKEENAKQRRAVIEVQTDGVQLVDPNVVGREPKLDQVHVQYRLDDNPAQNSASKSWTFENIPPGEHEIHVRLAANDNHPVGMSTTLKVKIP